MAPRVEESSTWARLERCSSPVLTRVAALAAEMAGAQEPQRMRTWTAAWAACGVRLRRRWLALVGVDASGLADEEIRSLRLVEVPYGGCSRCRPDLAVVTERPAAVGWERGDASLRPVRVIAVLEAKVRAYAAVNEVTACSAFGVADEAALPLRLRALVNQGWVDQLTLYRSAGEYVYLPDWDLSEATFALVTPGNCYAVPDGWSGADMEAVATLLLKAAERSGSDVFARAVAALIAPSRTYEWRGIPASGKMRAYATFGIRRSWDAWLGRIEIIYRVGADFGLALRARGWVPVDLDGVELAPAALPAGTLAAYAEALADHGDRAAWLTCTFAGCGAPAEAACGHVDAIGYHVSSCPALAASLTGPAAAA